MANLVPINGSDVIVDENGRPTQQFLTWLAIITQGSVIVGTGSPEGVVTATVSALYMDDSGSAGAILYVKKLADIGGDRSQGWILV